MSTPQKSASGAYSTGPVASGTDVVPFAGSDTFVVDSTSPSTSVSLSSTAMSFGAESSSTVSASSTPTGASFTQVTSTRTVAVAVPPLPSLTS